MISIPQDFDLGRDRARMRGSSDAARQKRTVEELLQRFFHADSEKRWELQLVADEVGMGKTFVALAVAYSLIAEIRRATTARDLEGCAPRVLVIAPHQTLAEKWKREVSEFVTRCVEPDCQVEASEWFNPVLADRVDHLVHELGGSQAHGVIVTHMGVLSKQRRLQHYQMKRRLLLGALFRFWGNRFGYDLRTNLLKGAPEWPRADELTSLTEREWEQVPFENEDAVMRALRRTDEQQRATATASGKAADDTSIERLLTECREIATPHTRGRDELFGKVEEALSDLYREVCFASLTESIPLVIVDEAHHWRNGPRYNTNGYDTFKRQLAPLCRRALLLTATPFQLKPDEVLELVKVGEDIAPTPDHARNEERRKRFKERREAVIGPVLLKAASHSRSFARSWARFSRAHAETLELAWSSAPLAQLRSELKAMAREAGGLESKRVNDAIENALPAQAPDVRDLLREGLRLYAYNEDLSYELGVLVVRHRRRTDHRLVSVGSEYGSTSNRVAERSDRHLLHGAPGLEVTGKGELPHYLLMRCVSEMKHGKGRSSLGTALTGCYSTLLESQEGRTLQKELPAESLGRRYFDLLASMVTPEQDAEHPKVVAVVASVLKAWRAGQKALVFCFRTHTAKRLERIIDDAIEAELKQRVALLRDGEDSLRTLRGRLTGRESDLIVLTLDRVLWSLRWAALHDHSLALPILDETAFTLRDEELEPIARLALRAGVDLRGERIDRVFVHRAVEHVLAKRLTRELQRPGPLFRRVLNDMASERWVEFAYGLDPSSIVNEEKATTASEDEDTDEQVRSTGHDERGVHARYRLSTPTSEEDVRELTAYLVERRARAKRQDQVSIFDTYAQAPSFWLGNDAEASLRDPGGRTGRTLAAHHAHLLKATRKQADLQWGERLKVLEALRRTVLTRSILLRLLPERFNLEQQGWAESLVNMFFALVPGQHESFAERLTVYVEDFQGAGGSAWTGAGARGSLYEASRLRWARDKSGQDRSGNVALIAGDTEHARRERVFAAFNSPLPPDVLVCTSVGQEGIDLHRHCRTVIHYDLAWNPAVLEQRTGRVDRIGSKAFRDRRVPTEGAEAFLDVGVPFLAGTYDERMYEELRIRAQTFEVLTGGDVSADNLEGHDSGEGAEGSEQGLSFPALPVEMVADLRVRLHVWEEAR